MLWADREPESIVEMIDKLRLFRSWFDAGEDFLYGGFSKDGTTCVGGSGLHPRVGKGGIEIGYWTHADHVRQGRSLARLLNEDEGGVDERAVRQAEPRPSPVRYRTHPRLSANQHVLALYCRVDLYGRVVP